VTVVMVSLEKSFKKNGHLESNRISQFFGFQGSSDFDSPFGIWLAKRDMSSVPHPMDPSKFPIAPHCISG